MGTWTLRYDRFTPEEEGHREALTALGNGCFCTRGAAPEAEADAIHYPGTYLAGAYNRRRTAIAGREVENEDLVNLPNWLPLTYRPEGGDWLNLLAGEILDYCQELDMRRGLLVRRVRFRDRAGRETTLLLRRLVHAARSHLAAQELTLTADNWSGRIEILSALDGRVINAGVERYRALNSDHLHPLETGTAGEDGIYLIVETSQSHLRIAEAARTRVLGDGALPAVKRTTREEAGYIAHHLAFMVQQGSPVRIEKIVALYGGKARAISECALAAREAIAAGERFAELLAGHEAEYARRWRRFDIELTPNAHVQCVLRLHIFHLLQTLSPHTIDLDVGVPARGWHGEAYRGHVFWDEAFVLPFFTLRIPDVTRALLLYRYRRLGRARQAAREAGFRGAMYPWQSGSDGREESQRLHLNPRSGRWLPDHTSLQRHVGAAIAYNVWQYVETTHDLDFLAFYGAEMILEIARFWASIASYDAEQGRYQILGVMGPDEYHDAYPDAERPGLNNNAYTNVMAAWVLCRALDVLDMLDDDRRRSLSERLDLGAEEIALWDRISRRMTVPFLPGGIIAQFEGYGALKEFDWEGYRARYGDIQRLDRILEAEGDSPNRYQLSKQADVLMLFYLFSAEEVAALFERLGYRLDGDAVPRTVDHYLRRTAHGSTLSRVVHSWVLARSDRAGSWRLFTEALESDIGDIQGGTTKEGIHLGAMAGTVDIVQRCYTGLELRGGALTFHPALPDELAGVRQRLRYRGHWLDVEISRSQLRIAAVPGPAGPVRIRVRGQVHTLAAGETLTLAL